MRTYIVCVDKTHPAYLKRGIVRRDDGGCMVLVEWSTWSYICTWVMRDGLSGLPGTNFADN